MGAVTPMGRVGLAAAVMGIALSACGNRDGTASSSTTTTAVTTSSTQATSSTTVPTTTASSQTTAAAARTLECETVGFTPQTEDAASSIRATGIGCDEARSFVKAAGALTSSGGPASVDVGGYRCVRTRSLEDPIPQAFYECTKDAIKVAFVRS